MFCREILTYQNHLKNTPSSIFVYFHASIKIKSSSQTILIRSKLMVHKKNSLKI